MTDRFTFPAAYAAEPEHQADFVSGHPTASEINPARVANGAEKLAEALSLKLSEAAEHIINELDQLIAEIEKIKEMVLADSGTVRGALDNHFKLASEALSLREKVSRRLDELKK
jgi:hypothetical protein